MRAILNDSFLLRREHPLGGYGDPYNGAAILRVGTGRLLVLFSNGGGWDHVSVSRTDRCPTWDEMCRVRERFFEPEDCVVQFHPPRSAYVNNHPFCLHLWRPQNGAIPLPDAGMVGVL